MSKFAILKVVHQGHWTVESEITVNVDMVVAIETEPGCADRNTRLTLSGGREVCVQGNHKDIRRALVKQAVGTVSEPSLWEQIFGHKANDHGPRWRLG